MNASAKRSASPLPRRLDEILRARISDDKKDKVSSPRTPLDVPSASAHHGQEVLSLSTSLQHDLRHENINDLILGTTVRLAREGKRLIKAPRLLADGIAFDWTYDVTARSEDIKSLLSVEGIRSEDLERVLLRATPVPDGLSRGATEEPSQRSIPPNRFSTGLASLQGPTAASSTGSASDPIVVDDDGGPYDHDPHSVVRMSASSKFQNITTRSPRATDSPSSYRTVPTERPLVSHSDVSVPVASGSRQVERSPSRNGNPPQPNHRTPEPVWSNDRLSVVSYASQGAEESSPLQDARQDVVQGDRPNLSQNGDYDNNASDRGSVRSRQPTTVPSAADPGKCTAAADYGEWKALAEGSSDVEMEHGRPSSRESSPARATLLPRATHAVEGLPFLPSNYDTSGLVSHRVPATASGSNRPGAGNSNPYSQRDHPSPCRVSKLPHRNPYRHLDWGSESEGANSPLSRRRAVQGAQPRTSKGFDLSDEDSDIDTNDKVQKPTVPHRQQRSNAASRNLRKARPSGSAGASQHRRGAPHRAPRSARPSASTANEGVESSSEDEEDDDPELSPSSLTTSGHTIVIPKADFARGRRLLVPANPDYAITTVLMRGEAHFIDQRRKTRIYRHSLPVEDDSRHVEDACLLGEGIVVVGYDKGPSQVSLITVEGDQRPCRIDLTHKAHSTVIENRSAGRAYPNRGIACLSPMTGDRFLSGGHDKYVYQWKLDRANGRQKERGIYSALAFSAWNETVYSAAGDRIATTKLDAVARAEPERVSAKVTQVHVHPQDPRLIALEVDHMDYQVHFYDMREGGFRRKPWLEFGYRSAPPTASRASSNPSSTAAGMRDAGNASASASTSRSSSSTSVLKSGSRYTRGSTTNSLFARGYGDGTVLVWDYRNGAQKKVLERFHFQRPAEVAHTVLAGSDVIAYGGYSVTFWSTLAANS